MYRNPQVSIQITEPPNQVVAVTEGLHRIQPLYGQKRLFGVLAAVDGLTSTASHTMIINRLGVPEPITVDLGTSFQYTLRSKTELDVYLIR